MEVASDIPLRPGVVVSVAIGSLIERIVESSEGGKLPALVRSVPTENELLVNGPRRMEIDDSRLNSEEAEVARLEVNGPFASVLDTVGVVFGIIRIDEVLLEDKSGKATLIETDVGAIIELPVIDVNVPEGDGKI